MTQLNKFIAAAILSAVTGLSQAAIVNLGELPLAPSVFSHTMTKTAAGTFGDVYNFVFPAFGDQASSSAITIDTLQLLNIDNLRVALFDSSNVRLAVGSRGESSQVSNVSLVGGQSYYFIVSGLVTGSLGGAYQFLATASPQLVGNVVPEPASAALVLAALAGLALARKAARS